ncbi:glycoside hydrolase family 65 protein [Sphaerisporangium sp. B11E5]|uniref:glycoside hydrolase family 65 protein n=1 Tax=Sphaerisporangium sp. B11E5 TaxID=3153563 RepID=UPI00325E3A76
MNPWLLTYDGYLPADEGRREALCALGNGYFVTRGAAPEARADGTHYPGTYVAGCYNQLTSRIGGEQVTNEELVNVPNWLPLLFATPESRWFHPRTAELMEYRQVLDLRHGVLSRRLRYRDEHGRVTAVRQRRLVSMADPHVAALETTFTAENWSGPIRVAAALDGRVSNRGVERYRDLRGDHLVELLTGHDEDHTWLSARTSSSGIAIVLASRLCLEAVLEQVRREPDRISTEHLLPMERERPATVTKIVALTTSRDHAMADPRSAAVRTVHLSPCFGTVLARHRLAWDRLWARARLDCDDPTGAQIIHLHTFHLLQTLSPHTTDLDVGVPARGLHGEAYRGHVFWDELFVLPWLNFRFPEISQALLRYRHRRLPEARAAANAVGLPGAMFPWQSGSDGQENTQPYHLNPSSGRWLPDRSRLQRHVGLAIGYNVWQHFTATGNMGFLADFGAELLVEIARFFAALSELDPVSGRYEIRHVVGPDEYHDAYPGGTSPGVDNNVYTNLMTVWLLLKACEVLDLLPLRERTELTTRLGLSRPELERWDEITRRMRVDFHEGVLSQFTGYADLPELDWGRYRGVRRLDRALEAEGDDVNRYKASKQADVLMLFYLLTAEELRRILARLGRAAEPDLIRDTIGYYLKRTSHGSTLSAVVHAWVLSRLDRAVSWHFFVEALSSDLADVQGGTTAEGIHLGAMGGTLDLVQRCYLGLEAGLDGLRLDPHLPDRLPALSLTIEVCGGSCSIDAGHAFVRVGRADDGPESLRVEVRGQRAKIGRGAAHVFSLIRMEAE